MKIFHVYILYKPISTISQIQLDMLYAVCLFSFCVKCMLILRFGCVLWLIDSQCQIWSGCVKRDTRKHKVKDKKNGKDKVHRLKTPTHTAYRVCWLYVWVCLPAIARITPFLSTVTSDGGRRQWVQLPTRQSRTLNMKLW